MHRLLINLKLNIVVLGLTNKKVLITGPSRGIGTAVAKSFLDEPVKVMTVSRGSQDLFDT